MSERGDLYQISAKLCKRGQHYTVTSKQSLTERCFHLVLDTRHVVISVRVGRLTGNLSYVQILELDEKKLFYYQGQVRLFLSQQLALCLTAGVKEDLDHSLGGRR